MVSTRSTRSLQRYEQRYRELTRKLADIGYIAQGSIAKRYTRCGKQNCACQSEPPALHGPYWHWSAKVNGKTVNRRLSDREAELYLEWIGNEHKVRELLTKMREVAAQATALLLKEEE
jgi:hypothetical protein